MLALHGDFVGLLERQKKRGHRVLPAQLLVNPSVLLRQLMDRLADLPLLDCVTDVVVVADVHGKIRYCNAASDSLLGWDRDELVGQPLAMLVGSKHHQRYIEDYLRTGQALMLGRPRRLRAKHRDGHDIPITLSASESFATGEQLFIGIIRDARTEHARERALARYQRDLEVQANIIDVLQSSDEPAEVVERVLGHLIELPDLELQKKAGYFEVVRPHDERARLHLVESGPQHLRLSQVVGSFSEEFMAREAVVPFGECLCGRAAKTGQVTVSANCVDDPRHERTFAGATPHGHYILPLKAGGVVHGVIFLYTEPHPAWDDHRIALLTSIATKLGIGLARLRAESQLRATHPQIRGRGQK